MTSRSVIEYVKGLRDRGKTVIFSAHNLFQVEEVCDMVLILRRGRVGGWRAPWPNFGRSSESLTYQVFFRIGDPATFTTSVDYTISDGRYFTELTLLRS